MKRYLYEYENLSTGDKNEMSVMAKNEDDARKLVLERAADFNFVEVVDIVVGKLLKVSEGGDSYFECEGCT